MTAEHHRKKGRFVPKGAENEQRQIRAMYRIRYGNKVEDHLRRNYIIPIGYSLTSLCMGNAQIENGWKQGRAPADVAHEIATAKGWRPTGNAA